MPRQQTTHTNTPTTTKVPTSFQYTGPIVPKTSAPIGQSFGQIMKEGFGFGVGTTLAKQMVEKLIGGEPHQVTTVKKEYDITSSVITDSQRILYNQCIIEGGIHDLCKEILQ